MKHLHLFETTTAFEAAKSNLEQPWVALTEDDSKVQYGGGVEPDYKLYASSWYCPAEMGIRPFTGNIYFNPNSVVIMNGKRFNIIYNSDSLGYYIYDNGLYVCFDGILINHVPESKEIKTLQIDGIDYELVTVN